MQGTSCSEHFETLSLELPAWVRRLRRSVARNEKKRGDEGWYVRKNTVYPGNGRVGVKGP